MTPIARNLVSAARAGLDPSAEAKARVRARVAMAVGGGTAAPVVAKSSLLAKLMVVGAVVVVVGGVAIVARERAVAAPTIDVVDREEARVTVPQTVAVHEGVAVPKLIVKPVRVAAPRVVVAASGITLAREVALIDSAMGALRANNSEAALATLVTYEQESAGRGQLEDDAAALGIDARCHLHQPVDELLAAFDQRYPGSAQRARLAKSCQ